MQDSIIRKEGYEGTISYSYNSLNQQVAVNIFGKEVQKNFYDSEGLRAGLEEKGAFSRFVFHQGEMLAEEDGNLALVTRIIRGYGAEACQQHGQTYCYQKDEQFSTLIVSNQEGGIENLYQYDAFGVVKEQYYLRARYYNPVLGRFMQEDDCRSDGLNLYTYCGNNPMMYCDFSGYEKIPIDGCNKLEDVKDDGTDLKDLPSAKGLYDKEFEEYLTKNIGGGGDFSKGGRDFDGGIENRWWEAKSEPFWENRVDNQKAIAKFKSDMGDRLRIAKENGATYELFLNTPIPSVFKDYLTKKGIPFTEILH